MSEEKEINYEAIAKSCGLKVVTLPCYNVLIEISSGSVFCKGDSFQAKEILKEYHFRWSPEGRMWYKPIGSVSFDLIVNLIKSLQNNNFEVDLSNLSEGWRKRLGEALGIEIRGQVKIGDLEIGVYELPSGEIYVVKPNMARTKLYAKRLVEVPSYRVTETGNNIKFDFVYERDAIQKIKSQYKMPLSRAKELMIKYGHCIVCGHRLKVAKSVELGMGPVCRKYFGV